MKSWIWKRIVSLVLAMVLLAGCLNGTGLCVVSAEEETEDILSVDRRWETSWEKGYDGASAKIDVSETTLYQLYSKDFPKTSGNISVVDNATGDKMTILRSNVSNGIYRLLYVYLVAGGDYTITYKTNESDGNPAGQLLISMTKTSFGTLVVGQKENNSRDVIDYGYVAKFTSSSAGDYRITFDSDQDRKRIRIIEQETGIFVHNGDTEYTYKARRCDSPNHVITLKENTTYILIINFKELYPDYCPFVINKCDKNLETVEIHEQSEIAKRKEKGESGNPAQWFSYRVTFADGTQEIMSFEQFVQSGYTPPEVQFFGYQVKIPTVYEDYYDEYHCGGTQPCVLEYNGVYSMGYVTFSPVTSDTAFGNGQRRTLKKSSSNCINFDLVMDSTGIYTLYADNVNAFKSVSYILLDHYFNPVNYNEKMGGFPLVGGQRYRVYIKYASSKETDVYFQKNDQTMFSDTHPKGWYYNAVAYTVGRGAVTGYASGNFGVSDHIQRQDFLLMLARFDGVDLEVYKHVELPFPDVAENSYYKAAVAWGYESGIVTGYNSGRFGVGDAITREQMATFLCRYAYWRMFDVTVTEEEHDAIVAKYNDFSRVSEFAQYATLWAIDRGVITGKNGSKIAPHGKAQRCEVAQMLYNAFIQDVF